jgi:hypothetical protein|uniref:Uncharacterized protein n=1 Tax=viral metagenome TaxID=1070528 RepID=A0A6C0CW21_9ZZZZ
MATTVDKNEQTLTNIQNLQSLEQNLFNSLATGISNGTLKSNDKDSIVKQINQLSQMRSNLYTFLNNNSVNTVQHLAASNNLLSQQAQTVIIVENELNDAKNQLLGMQKDKYKKLRMVEINTYYGDRYADHSSMMKSIVIICAVIILITIIFNKGFLPEGIYYLMLIIIIVVSVVILWYKYVLLISHDRMNYDEYDWGFNPDTAPKYDMTNPSGTNPWASATAPSLTCVGSNCCDDGMSYDYTNNVCVVSNSASNAASADVDTVDSILADSTEAMGGYAPF